MAGSSLIRLKKTLLLAIVAFGVLGAGPEESIRVSSPEIYADVVGTVSANGIGVVVVYMQSAGDAVSGFEIELFDVPRQRTVEKKMSDDNGVLRFAVPAGSYRIYLRKTREQRLATSARIAEIRIE